MLKSTLIVGAIALTLFAAGPRAAEIFAPKGSTPVATNEVSASGAFPTQAMEDQFLAYLAWTKAQGLSRLVAFEPRTGAADVLPNEAMRAAFEDYLVWTTRNETGNFYAFSVTNFD
ncbi:MAG TPA: hypothetical protein VLM84_09095 [Chromatiaceae bacterium]|jgi:hypothetical protein|nr:hypothetical protein [Chromatiaceae bacterium]